MRSWNSFYDEIKRLNSHRYEWPDGLAHDIQSALVAFDQLCLNRLHHLLEITLDDKEARLRQFFSMRWTVIENTSLDYTLNPALPTNQLFLRIAKEIANSEEAICSILMPTIERVIGSDSPDNIKYSSENERAEFHLSTFLINVEGNALISLEDVFSYAIHDTDFIFPVLMDSERAEKNPRFDLSAADCQRIRMVSSETALLFDCLEKNHRVRYQVKPSVGYALKILQIALLKSSKIEKGSDAAANVNECQYPVKAFYEIWCALPEKVRSQIGGYRANHSTITLQDYLFCLFAHTSDISLSDEQYKRVRGDIVPCTHMIGEQIQVILNKELDLNNIALPGFEFQLMRDEVHAPDALNTCYENHLAVLKNRCMMLGEKNRHVVARCPIFSVLTQYALDPLLLRSCVEAMSIQSMSDFMICLNMIPKESWEVFLSVLDNQTDNSYFNFVTLLKELNQNEWQRFFSLIFGLNFGDQFDASTIATILSEIPVTQHTLFVNAIDQYVDSVFSDAVDIFYILEGTEIHHWPQVIGYFQHNIDLILNHSSELIKLFFLIPTQYWLSLYSVFQGCIRKHLTDSNFFDEIYGYCDSCEERDAFISVISDDVDWITAHSFLLIKILHQLDEAEWGAIFKLFTPAHFRDWIKTPLDLFKFLHELDDAGQCVVIYHMRDYLSSMAMPPNGLCCLLEGFPSCQNILISVFKKQLPDVFSHFLKYFALYSGGNTCADYRSHKRDFLFLSRLSLPLLLSRKVIAEHCESFRQYHDDFSEITPDPVFRLYRQLRKIERQMASQQVSREVASVEKLTLLSEYVRFSKTMRRTKTPFYQELIAFYGKDFFDDMLKNCDSLLQVQGLGLFSSSATLTRAHTMSLIQSTQDNSRSMQGALSTPMPSPSDLFVHGTQMPLQRRLS